MFIFTLVFKLLTCSAH